MRQAIHSREWEMNMQLEQGRGVGLRESTIIFHRLMNIPINTWKHTHLNIHMQNIRTCWSYCGWEENPWHFLGPYKSQLPNTQPQNHTYTRTHTISLSLRSYSNVWCVISEISYFFSSSCLIINRIIKACHSGLVGGGSVSLLQSHSLQLSFKWWQREIGSIKGGNQSCITTSKHIT